jgi:uncharacterized protein
MANALADSASPYLRQHADNPVDWLPWGPEALERARTEDKPLLVSIGYSACHWCHVMAHESFEDPEVAAQMNRDFVCVKVDREERPDVDAVYMDAVQAMTGGGGWPLNAFASPEGVPFYAGTYFPPQPGRGMPAWSQVLASVAEAWRDRREEIDEQGPRMAERLRGAASMEPRGDEPSEEALAAAVETLRSSFDAVQGGWTRAPKFPAASVIELLLARGETRMSAYTLRSMASGGLQDQVAGGFHRYAVDATWTVPHFEKMLYDNALLARAYLHAGQLLEDPELVAVCERTLDWLLRDMRAQDGGFHAALDADTEGIEGLTYVWTLDELHAVLGEDAEAAIAWFGATAQGNFHDPHHPELTGRTVLEVRGPRPDVEVARRIVGALAAARAERPQPGVDDKRLASWNLLAVAALADAGASLDRADYLDAARDTAAFVLERMAAPDGGLLRTYNAGAARQPAFLEDHAYAVEALVVLYEATFEPRWLHEARRLADVLLERFADPERGGFYSTAADGETLVARRKELEDAPIPAGQSAAALGLLRLHALTGEGRFADAAHGTLRLLGALATTHPGAFGHLLQAHQLVVHPPRELAVVGPADGRTALLGPVRAAFRPDLVLAGGDGADPEIGVLAGREALGGQATAYVCEGFVCRAPTTDPAELRALLAS